jgi:hypothetical protein
MSSRLRQAFSLRQGYGGQDVAANLQDVPSPGLRARHSEAAAARSSRNCAGGEVNVLYQ